MGNKRSGINLSLFNQTEDLSTVTAVYTSCFESQILAIHLRQRKKQRFVIKSHNRDYRIGTGTVPRHPETIFGPRHFQNNISSTVITVLEYKLLAVLRCRYQYIGIMFTDKLNPFRGLFTDNDTLRILQHRAEQSANTGRTGTNDEDSVFLCNL